MKFRQWSRILSAVALVPLAAGALAAQDQDSNPNGDPPARVARIQYISGQVSMQPGGVNDWVAASMNRPLTSSDRVWADKDSRVELNVGTGFIRLDSESSLTLTNVSNNAVQVQLDQGTLELSVRHLEPGEIFEVDTPNVAFTVMKSGAYRIDVPPNDNQTLVTVRKGNGEATGQGPAVKVDSGEQVRFTGQGSLQHEAYAAPAADGFDDWANTRDKRLDGSISARYVAPGVIGYEDLDYYGKWRVVPTYGAVWVPAAVPTGWAPYRYGHWVWVDPWGWTWVDDAPWGFAPFHYGRWVFYGGAWGWAPGPVYVGWRPYYAPALVAWVGGAGWGVGVSFGFGWGGGCGWFPLGWGEPYYPWYHGYRGGRVSNTYVRNVNVTNTTINNITSVTNNYNHDINNTRYMNRNIVGAVTAAPKSALVNGQNIARAGTAVPQNELSRGEIQRAADVAPTRQSMLGGHAMPSGYVPPRGAIDRTVVTTNGAQARPVNPTVDSRNSATATSPTSQIMRNPSPDAASQSRVVPRPPDHVVSATAPAATTNQVQGAPQRNVPRPPYAGSPAPASTTTADRSYTPSSQAARNPTPATESNRSQAPPPANRGGQPAHNGSDNKSDKSKESTKGNAGMAYTNAPRPPASYTHQAAPAYSAPSSYSSTSASAGSSRGYTPPAAYTPNRSSYGAQSSAGRYSGGYSAPQSYSARATPTPAPHYSAPSYSGGNSGHASSGSYSHAASSSGRSGGHNR
jgi:hypothetical protein